jgi:hypothetical protein
MREESRAVEQPAAHPLSGHLHVKAHDPMLLHLHLAHYIQVAMHVSKCV